MKNSSFSKIYQHDIKSNFFNRSVFNSLNLFLSLDKIMTQVDKFDNWIFSEGISRASAKFLESLDINLKVKGLEKITNQDSYLFMGNHPSLTDPIAVIAALGCDEIKFFSDENVLKVGPHFSRHIFPIKNMQRINGKRKKGTLIRWIYCLFLRSLIEYGDREKAIIHNRVQVEKAADFLAHGGKFMIFPFGAKFKKSQLKKGVGFILSKAMQRKNGREIKLMPFYIKIWDGYIFSIRTLFKFRKSINLEIIFGKVVDSSVYQNLVNQPQTLALKIYQDYGNFIRTAS